ncbi:hypothetical protein [Spirosoma rhododendri]|uniref:SGNH/GDSL hydrolase family protein n=1 Tax=Spirosoma rhododendri TaxID=2728024 RepID=A0A7L5DJF4_9BACT|nr:hypothetical protein [Spirosoma rhododendri]QJD77571.1 hypothetical protein HH216_03430 [Spirosoma rhododendri]
MIWKSVAITGLLLLAYTLFINQYGSSINRTAQTTAQRNMVKAEEYLYEASATADTLIVGSSMSERLHTEQIAPQGYNLSFSGLSALEGLYLIQQSGHVPNVLFVEINSIARQTPTTLDLTKLTDPAERRIKKWLPFLRQKYQPVGVFKAVLRDWQQGAGKTVAPESAFRLDTTLQQRMVRQLQGEMSRPISAEGTAIPFKKALAYLSQLRQQGTTVILFEMPINARLENLLAPRTIRQYADRYFPAPAYQHIALPADSFRTSDGIHLLYDESVRYSNYLHTQYEQLARSAPRTVVSNQ